MVITIDGPAGAGKSSAARLLAERLGVAFLDTGAMYRAVTLAALREAIQPDADEPMRQLLAKIRISCIGQKTELDGEDVSEQIREPRVSQIASKVAANPRVRARMVELQRLAARDQGIVTEGRDQGTVVFPDADVKFFLTADPAERARRRHVEMAERGIRCPIESVREEIRERDLRDSQREIAPLAAAEDAIVVDSTSRGLEEVVEEMVSLVLSR